MKIKKLIKDIPGIQVKGSKEVEITGVCVNSKLVAPGNLFIAKKGRADDGVHYIPEAIAAGAVAIATDFYDPTLKDIVQLVHPNISEIEGKLAAQYYQFPSEELFTIGITGTNGKTTTSFLVKYLMDQIDGPCGLIGTIEYIIGQHRYQATRTTPDVCSNQKMLREMLLQGCHSAVMEATSHALDQGRVLNIDYDIAIFTNLTLDHLDYHNTMENYCEAKRKLFLSLDPKAKKKSHPYPKTAIVNADSHWHSHILQGCQAQVIKYAIQSPADLRAYDINLTSSGTTFILEYKGKTIHCSWPLIGRHNVYNFMAAVSVGLARNLPLEKVVHLLSGVAPVPGRLEAVPNPLGLKIYVDFAHSDDALINVFECLQELKSGRIITVFGCGGDRDKTKRPKMAKACEEYSDISIITSDNPRSEDPLEICKQISQGFQKQSSYIIEIDRRNAIEQAIDIATPNDIVLIAGKGHEPYQIFAHKTIEFDDRKVAFQICTQKADLLTGQGTR